MKILCTNTEKEIPLDPQKLFIKTDALYFQNGADLFKFNENALLTLAGYMDEVDGQVAIVIAGRRHIIPGIE